MTTVVHTRTHRPTLQRWWLLISVPIAALAVGGSLTGIFVDRIYEKETSSWAAEGAGQDIANLIVFPVLLVLAYAAARGSVRAYLAWLGTLVYAAYTYAIYVFDVHFGPLFLLYVAVFGMSLWALGGALTSLDPDRVRAGFRLPGRTTTFVSGFLMLVAGAFALLWLVEDVPSVLDGSTPDSLIESGLLTNPVHVIDLSLFLPAAMLAGILLRRGMAWGYCLAPVILTAMVGISVGIVSLTLVGAARDEDVSLGMLVVVGVLAVVEIVACWRFLQGISASASLEGVLRPRSGANGARV